MKAVFTFGRMNPPTVGHDKLVNKIRTVARKEGGQPFIYLSQTQDKKKNPVNYNDKIKFAKKAFGSKLVVKTSAKTIIAVMQELEKKGYKDVILVVGSDRVSSFKDLLNKYNGKDYTFDSITITSAGQRDPDADDVSGMSASKMRQLAKDEEMDDFRNGLPSALQKNAKDVYNAVRNGMGL
jgi:hypothetical protein